MQYNGVRMIASSNTPSDPLSDAAAIQRRRPIVYTDGDVRTLLFSDGIVQSEMLVSRPDALLLQYTRAMMSFALFNPNPKHILMVGLGGGSLAKFCYRYFPEAEVTVVEIDEQVIALRDRFLVPADGPRFRVVHADAVDVIGTLDGAVDVLMVDGFDVNGMPPALCSDDFYAACARALRPGGVLVANVHSNDPGLGGIRRRLAAAFGGRGCRFKGVAAGNQIEFAVKAASGWSRAAIVSRLVGATQGLGADLNKRLARLVVKQLERRR